MNSKLIAILACLLCLALTGCAATFDVDAPIAANPAASTEPPHQHTWQAAACARPKTCDICGETEGEALGHTWLDATCITPKTCEVCGETEGDANGHSWLDATCITPKTCEVCGETEGEALGHTWRDATCTKPKTCEVCGEAEGDANGHSWKSATCTKPQICKTCWITKGDPNGHNWKDATCTKPKTCVTCWETEGEPKGHDYQNGACTRCGIPAPTVPATGGTAGQAIVATAMNYIGVPYVWGGESPSGFDCSGYVQYVFNVHNIWLPRNSSQQYGVGTAISKSALQPGDLVFFGTSGVSHVGIYVGDGQFIHCSTSRGVIISELNSSYWSIRYIGAKRVV